MSLERVGSLELERVVIDVAADHSERLQYSHAYTQLEAVQSSTLDDCVTGLLTNRRSELVGGESGDAEGVTVVEPNPIIENRGMASRIDISRLGFLDVTDQHHDPRR